MNPTRWPAGLIDWPLNTGPVFKVIILLAAAAALVLLLRRERRWWTRGVPLALLATTGIIALLLVWIQVWWKPFPDAIPAEVTFWAAVGVGGLALAAARAFLPISVRSKLAGAGLAVVVLLGTLVGINRYYGQFPDLRAAFGLKMTNEEKLTDIPISRPVVAPSSSGQPQNRAWVPPPDMPAKGVVVPIDIPPTASHFRAQPGWAYLPPAYLASRRPLLPVLILLSGQPGTPRDWLNGGQLANRMDSWAADHQGLAPVVILPDFLGNPLRNPLCVDSPYGNVDTYLSRDVPAYINSEFQVQRDHRYWAIGGFSEGGTCALQMGANHPQTYPTFLSLSGNGGPYHNSRQYTLDHYFGGNRAALAKVNPSEILAHKRFPDSAAAVFNAARDVNMASAGIIVAMCRKAGMTVFTGTVPGTHSWSGWGNEATEIFPWLFHRWGLGVPVGR